MACLLTQVMKIFQPTVKSSYYISFYKILSCTDKMNEVVQIRTSQSVEWATTHQSTTTTTTITLRCSFTENFFLFDVENHNSIFIPQSLLESITTTTVVVIPFSMIQSVFFFFSFFYYLRVIIRFLSLQIFFTFFFFSF